MIGARNADMPMETNIKQQNSEDEPTISKSSYQQFIGKLLFLITTRPAKKLSQFMQNLRKVML